MNTIKTTITLKPNIFARLKEFVRRYDRTQSEVIEQGILQVIEASDQHRLQRLYDHLETLQGFAISDPELAHQSVNDILYSDTLAKGSRVA